MFRDPEEFQIDTIKILVQEEGDEDRAFFPAGRPAPASGCTAVVRNIAVNLPRQPFDVPPNQEDDEPIDVARLNTKLPSQISRGGPIKKSEPTGTPRFHG
jgi:hypothetical protein